MGNCSRGIKIDVAFQHLTAEQQQFIKQFWQSFSIQGHTAVQERFLRLWKRLPTLYRRFKERLANENQTRFPSIYRDLAEDQVSDTGFHQKVQENTLRRLQCLESCRGSISFKHWQDQDHALFYFDSDRYYLDDSLQEAGLFLKTQLAFHWITKCVGRAPEYTRHSAIPGLFKPVHG